MQKARNWILLRGLARGAGHWGSFAERMKARFPQDQFELLDLPGNGARFADESPLSISDYVRDLRSRSRFVKAGEKFQILSISLGSMITVEWMLEHPHEVSRAFLMCTSSAGFSPFYERFGPVNYLRALRLLGARGDEVRWETALLDMVTNSHERREEEILSLAEYTKLHPMRIQNVVRQLWAASRYVFPKSAPGEVHLLGSYGDRLVSPECTLSIAHRWGLKAAMHPWAGHDIPIDDPEWVLEHLL